MREWSRRGAWALVAGLVLGACSEGGDSGPVGLSGGPNAALEVRQVAGEEQEGEVGSLLGQPLVLEVVNADGSPAPGVEVQWVFEAGRGATSSSVALAGRTTRVVKRTDANGRAEVWWEMGTIPGAQQAIGGLAVEETVGVPSGGPQGVSWRWLRRVIYRAYAKTGSPAVVEVSPASATVGEADKIVLNATVKDRYGNVVPDAPVSWVSSNETVAKVDTAGTVEATQEGEATIVARSGTLEGASTVAVIDTDPSVPTDPEPVPAVQRVVAQPDTIRFSYVGEVRDLSARAFDGAGAEVSGVTFTYQTSNSSIVRVGTMGRVTARAVGTALIAVSALCCDVADSVVVIVDDVPRSIAVRMNGSTITSDTLDLEVGQSATLSAEALNEIGSVISGVSVSWASSNTSVVRVSSAGVATAAGAGQATITVSASGITAVVPTRVSAPAPEPEPQPGTLRVSPASVALTGVGSTMQLGVTARDAAGNTISAGSLTWQSRNTAVATVSSSGLVTARGVGTVMLAVSAACCESAEVPVTVMAQQTPPPSGIVRGNEPAGMLTLLDYSFANPIPSGRNDMLFQDGSGLGIVSNSGGTVRQVSTQDGPQSGPGAMERVYTPGLNGTGVGTLYLTFSDAEAVYLAAWVKHNAGFEWHPVSQKLAFVWDSRQNYVLLQSRYFDAVLSLYRSASSTPYNPNQGIRPSLDGGEWDYVEMLVDRASGRSGEAWVWLNGVLVNNHEIDMPYPFESVTWDSTWGGGGYVKSRTDYQWTDHFYVSVRR